MCTNCTKHGRYLSVLLTGELQKSYSVFHVLPFLRRSTEFYKIFTLMHTALIDNREKFCIEI